MMNRFLLRSFLFALILLSSTASFSQVAVGISVRFGPPPLPVYAQPLCPGPGYFWTPGYWAWNDEGGYYWVPGTWVVAPVGMLWTPGYWGWGGGAYLWHGGYWGPHVGFYGGINYGFGYGGIGFGGGEWRGGSFYYNRSVTNVSVTNVTNVYNRTVVVNENHVAYNGGTGGVGRRPTPQEEAFAHENHTAALTMQAEHERSAAQNRQNFASENHGRPAIAATARPGDFGGRSAVPARAAGGDYHPPAMSPREARVATPANKPNPNEGFHPFTPPSKSGSSSNGRQGAGSSTPNYRPNNPGGSPSRPNDHRPPTSSRPQSESRPATRSHPQSQPRHESAPNQNRRPAEQPRREAPPKDRGHQ